MQKNKVSFSTLTEGADAFLRLAISDLAPRNVKEAVRGGFMAGAQAILILMQEEAGKIEADDPEMPQKMQAFYDNLYAEAQAYFVSAQALQQSRKNKPKIILPFSGEKGS